MEIWRCPLQYTSGEDAGQDDAKEEEDKNREKKEEEKDNSYKTKIPHLTGGE